MHQPIYSRWYFDVSKLSNALEGKSSSFLFSHDRAAIEYKKSVYILKKNTIIWLNVNDGIKKIVISKYAKKEVYV